MAEKNAKTAKAAAKPAKKKTNVFKRVWNYLRECKGELKKITWTSPRTTTRNFFVVLAVIVVAGLFIFAVDRGLYALLGLVMNTAST
ncbi:MAG: preprotein translocase subunit SecE [Ruminococcus sp.]|jgi:preprotein translocase subunit SecE|nr:preprotein translocase subunit SecE [Ruminococcus sp.]